MSSWIHDALGDDHARIGDLIERLAKGAGSPEPLVAEIRGALGRHIRWEEESLFPALLASASSPRSIESLVIDHERILATLDRLWDDPADGDALRDLVIYLEGHNRDEEIGIYAEADRRLPEPERARLVRRFLDAPAPIQPRLVRSFQELVETPFGPGVNALCWPRPLPGDFAEVVRLLGASGDVESRLRELPGSPEIDFLLEDLRRLRGLDLAPSLEVVHDYARDDAAKAVPTDVYSFHADRATGPTDTWLCTYHGLPTEGLRNNEALRRVDVPETRAKLLGEFGGNDDDAFAAHLAETCADLHYVPAPGARPYSFGVGRLWRVAVEHPGSPVPPCIHRALPGPPRLLLIS